MLAALDFIKTLLGGWRGVVLASLLLVAGCGLAGSAGLNWYYHGKIERLEAEAKATEALISIQNKAVADWKEEADKQTAVASEAQERQLKMAAQFRAGLKDQAERLKFTGQCEPDVLSASEEFARLAK